MNKLAKSFLLILVIFVFFTPVASSDINYTLKLPAIIISAGEWNRYINIFESIISDSGVLLSWDEDLKHYDLGVTSPKEINRDIKFGNLKDDNYETAIFIFGQLTTRLGTAGGKAINPDQVINDLLNKIFICKEKNIKMVGINLISGTIDKFWDDYDVKYTEKVIEAVAPHMNLWILSEENKFNSKFIDIAKKNKINFISASYSEKMDFITYKESLQREIKSLFGLKI